MKCPDCGSETVIEGSECYPESGMEIECTNLDCEYEGPQIHYNKRTDKMKEAIISAFKIMEGIN